MAKFKGYERMERIVGKRFAGCWFDNFEIGADDFTELREYARDTCKVYARSLTDIVHGQNLILMGSVGTGKDHLAVSVLRAAMSSGISVRYERGSVICGICRKSFLENSEEVPYELLNVDLLVISDIEPTPNKASDFEERAILRLVDYRYTHQLPTIITSNLSSRSHMSSVIGERTTDRLFEGAVVVPMLWPSYRGERG